jgi:aminomethyltransferase
MPLRPLTAPERGWSTEALVNSPLKRTPLHDAHVKAGARMVPFGGWDMPVQYTGIVEEHRTVRAAVGLFDVSHMGEFEVDGPQALEAVQSLTTNDASALDIGQVQYSALCYPDGGIVDDLTVYRLAADRYMLTVNAGNIDKDWDWVTSHAPGGRWRNVSAETALIAVQGPKAERLVGRLTDRDVTAIDYYRFAPGAVAGVRTLISRTGYTGEDGFELYVAAGDAARLWAALLERGREDGVAPIGLGARDTLRLEMRYALYGNDIDATTNPIEAGKGPVHRPRRPREAPRRRSRPASGRPRDGRAGRRAPRVPRGQGRRADRRRHVRLLRAVGRPLHRDGVRRDSACRRRHRRRRRDPRPGEAGPRGEDAVPPVRDEEMSSDSVHTRTPPWQAFPQS